MEQVLHEGQLVTALLPWARGAPVLFSQGQPWDAVLRWNPDLLLGVFLFSSMVKFLTTTSVFMAAEVPESLLQIHSRYVQFGSED